MEELEFEKRTSGTVTYKKVIMEEARIQYDSSLNEEIKDLRGTVDMLRWEVGTLKDRVDELEKERESLPVSFRIVEVRETTVEEAKEKILGYYEEHKDESIYPDDVADALGLDLKITMQAAEELKKEGKLKEAR